MRIFVILLLSTLLVACASSPQTRSMPDQGRIFSQIPPLGSVENMCILHGVDIKRTSEAHLRLAEAQELYTSVSTQCGNGGEQGRGELASCKGNACLRFEGGRALGVLEADQGFVRSQRADGTVEFSMVTVLRCERGISVGVLHPTLGGGPPTLEVFADDCGNFPSPPEEQIRFASALPVMTPPPPRVPFPPNALADCNNPRKWRSCRWNPQF